MAMDYTLEDYQAKKIVFYGTRHCPLPKNLFSLFEKCRTRYGQHADLVRKRSSSVLVFDEELESAVISRRKKESIPVEVTDCVVWVSLFNSTKAGNRAYFLIGMGVPGIDMTEADMDNMTAPSQLLIQADNYLEQVYGKLRTFRKQNEDRYLKDYAFEVHETLDENLQEDFDCVLCARAGQCGRLICEKEREDVYVSVFLDKLGEAEARRLEEERAKCFPCAVFDMEWEGPNPTQFSGMILEDTERGVVITRKLDMYIKLPKGKKVSPIVRGLTHISDELLAREGVNAREALQRISGFFSKARVVCGQGIRSDMGILEGAYEAAKLPMPAVLTADKIADTAVMIQDVYDLPHTISLKDEANMMGARKRGERFHDARVDALITARLFAMILPPFLMKFRKNPIIPYALLCRPNALRLLNDFNGTPKKKSSRGLFFKNDKKKETEA